MTAHRTDEELMELIKEGSDQAFEILYLRYYPKLFNLMKKMLNQNGDLAKDLLQDVFLRLVQKPESFRSGRKFRPWIYTVSANECRKSYRKVDPISIEESHVARSFELTDPVISREEEFISKKEALNGALNRLSYDQREVFLLKHQQDLPIKEIASILNCAEGTVKSRLFACRKFLAKELKSFNRNATL